MGWQELTTKEWDCIVVGTGMGGSVLGLMLAKAGWRVLFIERGRHHLQDAESLRGNYAETFFRPSDFPQEKHAELLSRAGRYGEPLVISNEPRPYQHIPFIGSGTGGSTALYGMALERFFPSDFTPAAAHPSSAVNLPEEWPFSYEDLEPYYRRAEGLFGASGTVDPLRPSTDAPVLGTPPVLSPLSELAIRHLESKHLHPYRIPMACGHVPGCAVCQGYLCPKGCKRDAATAALVPAITAHGAGLLDRCAVTRLHATADRVERVVCEREGRAFAVTAPLVVLAAGALNTPRILLSSSNDHWPSGLGNRSDQVGRNLMRHYTDLYAVTLGPEMDNHHKEIAFNDFYNGPGGKLGTVQSFGRLPPASTLAESVKADIAKSAFRGAVPLYQIVKPILKRVLARMVDTSVVLATICEDLPHPENRVQVVDGRLHLRYAIDAYDRGRIASLRRLMREALLPLRYRLIKQAENPGLLAHVCGTCRAGRLPAESVVDQHNRCHDLENLYVVDASFFPSSGGTNPALTIAANAMRVADQLLRRPPLAR
jgi:choline dehydrogenase-like flavoprotein